MNGLVIILNVKVEKGVLLFVGCFIFLLVLGLIFLIVGIFNGDGK